MSSIATTFKAGILIFGVLHASLSFNAAAEWVETAKLLDSDGEAFDHFGGSVAIDNGTLVVGVRRDDVAGATQAGSATIFELSDNGEWVAQQKLTASDAEEYTFFGKSVSILNGIVAVGAPFEDDGGDDAVGTVYIYAKGADRAWTESQKLIHSDAAGGDLFGNSLAMHGNTLIVGADGDDSDSGSVFIFTRSSGTLWTQVAKLTARDRSAGDQFGHSVAINADTILVGARLDDDLGDKSGSAYVFQREGQGGSWTQVAKLIPSDGQANDWFGRTVALEEGTVWVGSFNNEDGENVGAAYQFEEEGGSWTQQNKLVARDFVTNGRFGHGLAFRDGTLVVGADGQDSNTGGVYVFQQESDDVWTQSAKLVASDRAADDIFGGAVSVDDHGMIITAAPGDNSAQGSVYAFEWRVPSARPSVEPTASMQPSPHPSVQPSSVESSNMPSIATSVIPTGPTAGYQPIVVVVFVGFAFLAGAVAVWIVSRRHNTATVPNQDVPNNDHRVVFTDDVSELEEPSLGKGVLSVEASAMSRVHSFGAGTASIDHSQQTSHF